MADIYLTFDDGPYQSTLEVLDALRSRRAVATFFLQLRRNTDRGVQWTAIRRMVSEGHALANHGVDHDPMTAAGYKATKPAEVHKDFADNERILKEMFGEHDMPYPGMKIARLPGDGRFQKDYVNMTIRDFKIPHASWDMEFAPPGVLRHVASADWQGVKGVSSTSPNSPKPRDILLLHDLHWKNKGKQLQALVAKLQDKFQLRTLAPVPSNLKSVRYP